MRTLAESTNLLLGHVYEDVFVVRKDDPQVRIPVGDHHGDPTGGLIDPAERWVVSVGVGVCFFRLVEGDVRRFLESGFPREDGTDMPAPVVDARLDENGEIRILVDPYSDHASTWALNPDTLELRKLSDGPDLRGQPYREDVEY